MALSYWLSCSEQLLVLESASIHRHEQVCFRQTHWSRAGHGHESAKSAPNRSLQFTIPRLLHAAYLRAAGSIKLHSCRDNPARLFVMPRLLDAILASSSPVASPRSRVATRRPWLVSAILGHLGRDCRVKDARISDGSMLQGIADWKYIQIGIRSGLARDH
jgi:hypothetical protein